MPGIDFFASAVVNILIWALAHAANAAVSQTAEVPKDPAPIVTQLEQSQGPIRIADLEIHER